MMCTSKEIEWVTGLTAHHEIEVIKVMPSNIEDPTSCSVAMLYNGTQACLCSHSTG